MLMLTLYRIGRRIALLLPITVSYRIAAAMADLYASVRPTERANVAWNISHITKGAVTGKELERSTAEVFRNFARYLVDFFRIKLIDEKYVNTAITRRGFEHLDAALNLGKGAILLSAHIGNWELAGAIASRIGYDVHAVVLPHSEKGVNAFFRDQRETGGMHPIEMGTTLKACYSALRAGQCLALLGDRDFTRANYRAELFGIPTTVPKGPAALSYRLGCPVVPVFFIREPNHTYTIVVEPAIYPDAGMNEEAALAHITRQCLDVIEKYIRNYYEQWYIFKKIGSAHA